MKRLHMSSCRCLCLALFALVSGGLVRGDEAPEKGRWVSLFNGKDLDGWVVKIKGYKAGENFGNTFRVEDGLLKVVYDQYPRFDNKFGHLYTKQKFSHYRLRIEYRFVGQQVPGGAGWALRNSGVMVHSQSADSLRKEQDFPVSIEVQFLGGSGSGSGQRPTANLCTPGTHVVLDGKLHKQHCTNSRSKTYHGEQWVTVEVEVRGSRSIKHFVNGQPVLEYEQPQYDDTDPDARALMKGGDKLLGEGHLALQSESHPIEFRKVEIMRLD